MAKTVEKSINKDGIVKGQVFIEPEKNEIITYKVVNYIEKTGDGENDFVVKQKMVIANKVNRADSINSYSGDVGIQNVLKKVALSGEDLASVVDSGKFYSKQKGLVDLSEVPDNVVEAYKKVEDGVKAFDNLPKDLKKKSSMAHFASEVTNEEIYKYIDAKIEAITKASKKEEK